MGRRNASSSYGVETAFEAIAAALVRYSSHRTRCSYQHPRIVAFTAASRLPTLFAEKQAVESGGLMAYGASNSCWFPARGRLRR